jgi:hypothetical protein
MMVRGSPLLIPQCKTLEINQMIDPVQSMRFRSTVIQALPSRSGDLFT